MPEEAKILLKHRKYLYHLLHSFWVEKLTFLSLVGLFANSNDGKKCDYFFSLIVWAHRTKGIVAQHRQSLCGTIVLLYNDSPISFVRETAMVVWIHSKHTIEHHTIVHNVVARFPVYSLATYRNLGTKLHGGNFNVVLCLWYGAYCNLLLATSTCFFAMQLKSWN